MIPGSIPLALCTVVFRRYFDSVTGRIPVLPTSNIPNMSTLFMVSGALFYLYSHLKKGTLVNVGRRNCSSVENRSMRRSWFFKNLWGKRKSCTDAMFRIAKQFSDSVTDLNPCLLLPRDTFQVSFPGSSSLSDVNDTPRTDNPCQVIYESKRPATSKVQSVAEIKKTLTNASGDKNSTRRTKRPRKHAVKRLARESGSNDVRNKQSNLCVERRTRSGKIYNLVQ
ncbi:uncharacterized protein LOC130896003 [Diorhabda carinulata]|uniref:uncharacterized protein LOC130896003 n=1 Tax=Diorhabda carinulata TaxID=1163345 RepID=UPI0025A19191|nr:uncharacterized protein LOC130896003 [Diorhabda carinulata]